MSGAIRRVVVKVGTSTLTGSGGKLDCEYIGALCACLSELCREGLQVTLVTSGAVAAGVERLHAERPRSVPLKQAAAAVGQGILVGRYAAELDAQGLTAAQVLLTRQDIADRLRYTNARNTFQALFRFGVIPVVNENDTVAVDELRFGDNDELAAMVAFITDADLLVVLSDVEGLLDLTREPNELIGLVEEVTPAVEALARSGGSQLGTGGMLSKLRAARMVTRAGIPMVLARGRDLSSVTGAVRRWKRWQDTGLDSGAPGTLFLPAESKLRGRKRWLAFGSQPRGALTINENARVAIADEGRSLLPAGILAALGRFDAGDLVRICDAGGRELGRGIVTLGSAEIGCVAGRRSDELPALLGRTTGPEAIHRDNMVLGNWSWTANDPAGHRH